VGTLRQTDVVYWLDLDRDVGDLNTTSYQRNNPDVVFTSDILRRHNVAQLTVLTDNQITTSK
jgi:hypothetical protein